MGSRMQEQITAKVAEVLLGMGVQIPQQSAPDQQFERGGVGDDGIGVNVDDDRDDDDDDRDDERDDDRDDDDDDDDDDDGDGDGDDDDDDDDDDDAHDDDAHDDDAHEAAAVQDVNNVDDEVLR